MTDKHEHGEHGCAICDALAEGKTREQVMAEILVSSKQMIAKEGVAVHAVDGQGEAPSFAFTVGMTEMGLPEVFLIGLDPQLAGNAVYTYFRQIKDGTLTADVRTIDTLFNMPVEKCDVVKPEGVEALNDMGHMAVTYYEQEGKTVKWQQLVLCDAAGLFPWEVGFDHERMSHCQPLFAVPESMREMLDLMNEEDDEQQQAKDFAETVIPPTIH